MVKAQVFSILIAILLSTLMVANVNALTSQEFQNTLGSFVPSNTGSVINATVGGNWSSIDMMSIDFNTNNTMVDALYISQYSNDSRIPIIVNGTVVNGTVVPPPVLVEICNNGIDDDNDGLVDEGCTITPPPNPDDIPDAPNKDFNTTQILRVCSVGDIDNNNGLVTQLNLMNDYNCQIPLIPGDYAYNSATGVFTKLTDHGFTKGNTAIALGNHDNEGTTIGWTGMSKAYGTVVFNDNETITGINAYLGVFLIDGNADFDCSSTQFNYMKDQINSDEAWYKFAVVHQPFVTVKSDHGPNGEFDCWDPLFRANNVDGVLQAHNHNYQRFDINGLEYFVFGTGTHDTGSSMYPLNSDNWNNFDCLSCITGTNGITIMDLKIDDPAQRNVNGWFLSNSGDVKDKFNLRD